MLSRKAEGHTAGPWSFCSTVFKYNKAMRTQRTTTKTADGIDIELVQYGSLSDQPTVMLVHGTIANQRCWAPAEGQGIAPALARADLNVFTVNLRGRANSDRPDEPWGIREYVDYDLPAAIEEVLCGIENDRLHYTGHSMGAMLYFLLRTRHPELTKRIASATLLAGSIDWPVVERSSQIIDQLPLVSEALPVKPLRTLYRSAKGSMGVDDYQSIANTDNVPEAVLKAAQDAFSDTSPKVAAELITWKLRQRLGFNHTLSRQVETVKDVGLPAPVRMLNSPADQLIDLDRVRRGAQRLDHSNLQWAEVSPDNGCEHQYEHMDMLYARGIYRDILPEITDQINRCSSFDRTIKTSPTPKIERER